MLPLQQQLRSARCDFMAGVPPEIRPDGKKPEFPRCRVLFPCNSEYFNAFLLRGEGLHDWVTLVYDMHALPHVISHIPSPAAFSNPCLHTRSLPGSNHCHDFSFACFSFSTAYSIPHEEASSGLESISNVFSAVLCTN